jgi:hypothetical protein
MFYLLQNMITKNCIVLILYSNIYEVKLANCGFFKVVRIIVYIPYKII